MADTDTTTQPYRVPQSEFKLIGYVYNTGSKRM